MQLGQVLQLIVDGRSHQERLKVDRSTEIWFKTYREKGRLILGRHVRRTRRHGGRRSSRNSRRKRPHQANKGHGESNNEITKWPWFRAGQRGLYLSSTIFCISTRREVCTGNTRLGSYPSVNLSSSLSEPPFSRKWSILRRVRLERKVTRLF